MSFPKAYEKFRSAMIAYEDNLRALGRSGVTIKNQEQIFKNFSGFLLENKLWDHEEGFPEILAWRDQMRRDGKKPSTIKQYLTVLSAMYNFASSEELGENRWYDRNPVAKLLMPDTRKLDKRPYEQFLTDEQVMLLWRNNPPAKTVESPKFWPRNYAIVILLLTTELRNSELLALTPADLDWENSELYVEHGKGDKFRPVEFPPLAQTAVRLYLRSELRPASAGDHDPLFGTEATKEFKGTNRGAEWHAGTRQWLSDVVKRHVKTVTGVDMIRSHDLRHVGARLDLNSGMSFEELQAKLGHESVATTQIYSGKLTSRKNRRLTKIVQEEKERQAQRNVLRLEESGDDFFAQLRLKQPRPEIA